MQIKISIQILVICIFAFIGCNKSSTQNSLGLDKGKTIDIDGEQVVISFVDQLETSNVMVYAENYEDVVFVLQFQHSTYYKVISVIDFTEQFEMYNSLAEYKKSKEINQENIKNIMDRINEKRRKLYLTFPQLIKNKSGYLLIDFHGIYYVDFMRNILEKKASYALQMDKYDTCNQLKKRISSKPEIIIKQNGIDLLFSDSTSFTYDDSIHSVNVVDKKSCLYVTTMNTGKIREFGEACKIDVPLCE